MEKILRKVSCKYRLPEKSENYLFEDESGVPILCFYSKQKSGDRFIINGYFLKDNQFEYWYEEVDLDSKVEIMAKQYSNGHKNRNEIEDAFISGHICNRIYNEEQAKVDRLSDNIE